jgi:hypothetical protein
MPSAADPDKRFAPTNVLIGKPDGALRRSSILT